MGWKAFFQKEYDQAETYGAECLRLRRKLGVKVGVAAALDLLGTVARVKGEFKKAEALLEESLMTVKGMQSRFTTSVTMTQLGHVAQAQGDFERAAALYTEAMNLSSEIDDEVDILEQLGHLLFTRWRQGRPEIAAPLLSDVMALSQKLGLHQSAAAFLLEQAQAATFYSDRGRAIAAYEIALSLAPEITTTERAELQAGLSLLLNGPTA
ncbi:MAG: tetratricopeptide repeat protein [Chloroflexi bacterium]|nr:tetratricopeptide repeat protein [Chloroflexota bacterium]